jgi:type VI protein secretion system component VasK
MLPRQSTLLLSGGFVKPGIASAGAPFAVAWFWPTCAVATQWSCCLVWSCLHAGGAAAGVQEAAAAAGVARAAAEAAGAALQREVAELQHQLGEAQASLARLEDQLTSQVRSQRVMTKRYCDVSHFVL